MNFAIPGLRNDPSAQSFWFDKSIRFDLNPLKTFTYIYIRYIHAFTYILWAIMLFTYHLQNTVDESDTRSISSIVASALPQWFFLNKFLLTLLYFFPLFSPLAIARVILHRSFQDFPFSLSFFLLPRRWKFFSIFDWLFISLIFVLLLLLSRLFHMLSQYIFSFCFIHNFAVSYLNNFTFKYFSSKI